MEGNNTPLRADAERNRQAIICAAGSLLSRDGDSVTLEMVAREAGVGVGTVYRRFRTIEELTEVVLEAKMERFADFCVSQADLALSDPAGAFRDFVLGALEEQSRDAAFASALFNPRSASKAFTNDVGRALNASKQLIESARAAGVVHAGFHHTDLYFMFRANAGMLAEIGRDFPTAWKRLGEYLLAGFRHQITTAATDSSL